MSSGVRKRILDDPFTFLDKAYPGIQLERVTVVEHPTTGRAKNLVNGRYDVCVTIPRKKGDTIEEDMFFFRCVALWQQGNLTLLKAPSPSEEQEQSDIMREYRQRICQYLFGEWGSDNIRTSDGRLHRLIAQHTEQGMPEDEAYEEAATDLFGCLDTIGVLPLSPPAGGGSSPQTPLDLLDAFTEAHFVEGDWKSGAVRDNFGGTDSRPFQLTVLISSLTREQGEWPVGNGTFQSRRGGFGLIRLTNCLIAEIQQCEKVVNKSGVEVGTVVFATEPTPDNPSYPKVRQDGAEKKARELYLSAESWVELSPARIASQPLVDPPGDDEHKKANTVRLAVLDWLSNFMEPMTLPERVQNLWQPEIRQAHPDYKAWLEFRPGQSSGSSPTEDSDANLG